MYPMSEFSIILHMHPSLIRIYRLIPWKLVFSKFTDQIEVEPKVTKKNSEWRTKLCVSQIKKKKSYWSKVNIIT